MICTHLAMIAAAGNVALPLPTVQHHLRLHLDRPEDFKKQLGTRYLIEIAGVRAYPVYHDILASPEANANDISRIFFVLSRATGDRFAFMGYTQKYFAHRNNYVRAEAINFFRAAAPKELASLLIPLLGDESQYVAHRAALAFQEMACRTDAKHLRDWLSGDPKFASPEIREKVLDTLKVLESRPKPAGP